VLPRSIDRVTKPPDRPARGVEQHQRTDPAEAPCSGSHVVEERLDLPAVAGVEMGSQPTIASTMGSRTLWSSRTEEKLHTSSNRTAGPDITR
jgi:hypothetical protein